MPQSHLVLLPDEDARRHIRRLQEIHHATTGDMSPYSMPPCIRLHPLGREPFKRLHFPRIRILASTPIESSDDGYILPVDDDELTARYGQIGFFFSKEEPVVQMEDFTCLQLRTAILEEEEDGGCLILE